MQNEAIKFAYFCLLRSLLMSSSIELETGKSIMTSFSIYCFLINDYFVSFRMTCTRSERLSIFFYTSHQIQNDFLSYSARKFLDFFSYCRKKKTQIPLHEYIYIFFLIFPEIILIYFFNPGS